MLKLSFDGMSRVDDNLACKESQIRQNDVEGEDAHEMKEIQPRSAGKLRRLSHWSEKTYSFRKFLRYLSPAAEKPQAIN